VKKAAADRQAAAGDGKNYFNTVAKELYDTASEEVKKAVQDHRDKHNQELDKSFERLLKPSLIVDDKDLSPEEAEQQRVARLQAVTRYVTLCPHHTHLL
jgi:hypothetical protein